MEDFEKFIISLSAGYLAASLLSKEESTNCKDGVNTLNGEISGSPLGGPGPSRMPFTFANMNKLYENHNLVYTKDFVYIIPARNNIAVGSAQVFPLCDNPSGFGSKEQDGCGNARANAINHPGQNGTGFCGCGFRSIWTHRLEDIVC